MSDNGSGTYTPPASAFPEVNGTEIDATRYDAVINDLAVALSNRICKDGQTSLTAHLPFNGFKATGMAQGTARTDSATLANVQDGTGVFVGSVGGTANAITLTVAPPVASLTAGQTFRFFALFANTGPATLMVSGIAAKAITKNGLIPLAANDIPANGLMTVTYNGTGFLLTATSTGTLNNVTINASTLNSPILNNGELGFGVIDSSVLNTCTVGANPTTSLGVASMQYADKLIVGYTSVDVTLGATVGFASLQGASFIITLPAAADNSQREVTFVHQGTSLTAVYTIKGNGAETIIDSYGTATNTYLLYTAGEEVTLKSNGASWYVRNHHTQTDWVDAGAMTITGTTSNPTKPTTPDLDKVYWRREGTQVYLRYVLQLSSATGSAAGSGNYLFALPTNISFDTTIMTPVATAIATATRSEAASSYLAGSGMLMADSSDAAVASFYAYNTTTFQVQYVDVQDGLTVSAGAVGSAHFPLNNSECSYTFELHARATNWRL